MFLKEFEELCIRTQSPQLNIRTVTGVLHWCMCNYRRSSLQMEDPEGPMSKYAKLEIIRMLQKLPNPLNSMDFEPIISH